MFKESKFPQLVVKELDIAPQEVLLVSSELALFGGGLVDLVEDELLQLHDLDELGVLAGAYDIPEEGNLFLLNEGGVHGDESVVHDPVSQRVVLRTDGKEDGFD